MLRAPRLITLLLLALVAAPAWTGDAYRIEVVVFGQHGGGNELLTSAEAESPVWETVDDLPVSARDPGANQLGPSAYTLERRGYPVLLHTAWIETVGNRGSRNWHRVDTSRLQGAVRVTRGRYLHFDSDLVIEAGDGEPIRATDSRRMRSSEVHYIDHPRIGILVRIDPYTPP